MLQKWISCKSPVALLALFFILIFMLPQLLREGMFLDGLIYASVSRNMANGIGSFWFPRNTEVVYRIFHEHPPLAFGIQSIFFRVFGDHLWVEKLYTALMAIGNLILVVLLAKKTFKTKNVEMLFFPVFLLSITAIYTWSMRNNLLENTYSIFTLAAVLLMMPAQKKEVLRLLFAGVFLYLGMLTKGFVALFPLVIPVVCFLVYRNVSFFKSVKQTVILVAVFIGLMAATFVLIPDSVEMFSHWFERQVMQSISGERGSVNRFFILKRFVQEILPALGVIILLLIINGKKGLSAVTKKSENQKHALFFLLIGLSATLPLIISPKQHDYYMVPALPFFVLALTAISYPLVEHMLQKLSQKRKATTIINMVLIGAIAMVTVFSIATKDQLFRDKQTIRDVKKIQEYTGSNIHILVKKELIHDYILGAYLQRYYQITPQFTPDTPDWYITNEKNYQSERWSKINDDFSRYYLYKKN